MNFNTFEEQIEFHKTVEDLSDVHWLYIGSTDMFKPLKDDIAHVIKDTQGFIDEIQISDVIYMFNKHGYKIVKA